jgi:F0F1-type ATP synthase membrane subunit b/b'
LDAARNEARELIRQGKSRLDGEAATAKSQLAVTADALADQIVQALLERSAA